MTTRWISLAMVCIFMMAVRTKSTEAQQNETLARKTWMVNGVEREALVRVPTKATSEPSPVVFGFHGHGGSMLQASRSFQLHRLWPEAIVVYMQGLNTPGRLTDPEGKKPGWQSTVGAQEDRDLHFFDAVWKELKEKYKVDEQRVFSTGHSNGGGFTYLLWGTRGELFKAMAPSSAVPSREEVKLLKPKPVLHIAGEKDTLVKYEWQVKAMEALRKLNESSDKGEPYGEYCTKYTSTTGPVVITCIHPGGHQYYRGAPELIVKFFKEQ